MFHILATFGMLVPCILKTKGGDIMAKINDVLQLLGELTNSEKAVIAECLHFDSSSSKNISAESFMVSARFQENICCVECGSINIIKNGKRKDGVQKYICKDCHRNFTATFDTVISGSKKALYTWIKYIECMLDDNTLQECADKCHIHLNTAFLWRHKLLEASLKSNENIILDGKIEMDETFFRTSYKGNHTKGRYSFVMPRASFERGHHSKPGRDKELKKILRSRGISMEQVCVHCAVTSDRQAIAKVCKLGSVSSLGLIKTFDGHIASGSVIVSDESKAYPNFSKKVGATLIQIDEDAAPIAEINIQRVDSFHSQMKRMLNHRFCGVATKYLNNYIELLRINLLSRRSRANKLNIILNLIVNFVGATKKTVISKNNMPVLC